MKTEGSPWAKELYEMFRPVRESLAQCSEATVNQAIDEALKKVRDQSRERTMKWGAQSQGSDVEG